MTSRNFTENGKDERDIVEQLRERSENWEIDCKFDPSCDDAQMDRDAADEIERLRKRLQACQSNDSTPLTDDFITQNERVLFAELEQLRSLITAWADAEDLHYHHCESVECGICFRDTSKDPQTFQQACDALRKAVGR